MRARDALAAALLVGCGSPSGPPPATRLELFAVPTIVAQCDGELAEWAVDVRETGERYTSACDEPIFLSELIPYYPYTLEITGRSPRGSSCWSGTCSIAPLPGLDIAQCPPATAAACVDAGEP